MSRSSSTAPCSPTDNAKKKKKLLRIPVLCSIACVFLLKVDISTVNRDLKSYKPNWDTIASSKSINVTSSWQWTTGVSSVAENVLSFIDPLLLTEDEGDNNHAQKYQEEFRDHHYTQIDVLDLLDWEEESLHGLLTPNVTDRELREHYCNPPHGISKSCCLGSFSTGGAVTDKLRSRCAASMDGGRAFEALRQDTYRFFEEHALIKDDNEDDDDDSSMNCDICRIVELARQDNLHIVLLGDSMHFQVMDGLKCELERRNYHVVSHKMDHNPNKTNTHLFRRLLKTYAIQVRSNLWENSTHPTVVTIVYHMMYLVPLIHPGTIATLTSRADVVVLGFGLHWLYQNMGHPLKTRDAYVTAMADLFRDISRQDRVKLLVHRETSAQHFDADGGEFSLWYDTLPRCTS
jgi:hypothetical protein